MIKTVFGPVGRDLSEDMTMTRKPRLVMVIVRAGHAATFDWLCRRYGGKAVIIEDRRLRERRPSGPGQGVRLPATERRSGGDRRQPLTLSEKHRWREAGYCLVYGGK
jgi:hypothetical protein